MTKRYRIQLSSAAPGFLYLKSVVMDHFNLISMIRTTPNQIDAISFCREEAEKMRDKLERGHGYAVSFEEVVLCLTRTSAATRKLPTTATRRQALLSP